MTSDLMICRISGEPYIVSEAERAHLHQLSQAHPLLSEPLPLPKTSPYEFFREITVWGNLLNLYKSKSALSGCSQVSRYNPALGYRICTPDEFWSCQVDNTAHGRPYDFSRPFFEQIDQLLREVYLVPLNASFCEGSEYVNGANGAKDSYLCFGIFNSRACLYSYMVRECTDCIDCVEILKCELCYDCHTLKSCYECRHCRMCYECSDCIFCEDCIGCRHCLFSFGLRNATYCIGNVPVTKIEYDEALVALAIHRRDRVKEAKERFARELLNANYSTNSLVNAEDSTGHFLTNTKNVRESFFTHDALDCGYLMLSNSSKDFWRGFSEGAELGYQSGAYAKTYGCYNCYMDVGGAFNLYSLFMYNGCQHCFGSVGLNKRSYCILNNQYSKEEYFELVPRIISHMKATGEWGNFFPAVLSPHFYEHSFCHDWLEPISGDEAKRRGYRIGGETAYADLQGEPSGLIPNSSQEITDDLGEHVYGCERSGRAFKFQKSELLFHKRTNIPLPSIHWRERVKERIAKVFLIPSK